MRRTKVLLDDRDEIYARYKVKVSQFAKVLQQKLLHLLIRCQDRRIRPKHLRGASTTEMNWAK